MFIGVSMQLQAVFQILLIPYCWSVALEKKKKKKKKGVVFRWLVAATPFFLQRQFRLYLLRKDGRGLIIVRRPTDLQLRETVGIPETRYFFWLA